MRKTKLWKSKQANLAREGIVHSLKKTLFIAFILYSTTNITDAEAQSDLQSFIKDLQPSVVSVTSYDGKGNLLSRGTGFFISKYGEVLTRRRVFPLGTSRAEVKTSDGKRYPVTSLVNEDAKADLVVMSVDIPVKRVKPLAFKSTLPEPGELVLIISGNMASGQYVIEGSVSSVEEASVGRVLRVKAAIGEGSNGSPVINRRGEVVGVALFLKSGEESFIANAAESLAAVIPFDTGLAGEIKKPKPLNRPEVSYTEQARKKGVEGSVYVRALIGVDGGVKQVRVLRGLP
ncbi:MAG TPA: trypsin-like peptidase domain-containing protein, partial [Candidatus Saccharimonadales bacterium]|nr:trypsin-like peptidase domain-containing protein [Candidatus Saccharimonadales bacterium]